MKAMIISICLLIGFGIGHDVGRYYGWKDTQKQHNQIVEKMLHEREEMLVKVSRKVSRQVASQLHLTYCPQISQGHGRPSTRIP